MKTTASSLLRLIVLVLGLTTVCAGASANELKPAPDFSINDNLRLSDLKGKVVYLDFWASWCGPCRKSFPWMNQLSQQFDDKDFVVVGVNLDSEVDNAKKFLLKFPAKFPIAFNPEGDIAEKYHVMGMPSSFVIDKQGRIAASHIGFFKKQLGEYEQQIKQLVRQHKGKQ